MSGEGKSTDHRRKWDRNEYERMARERILDRIHSQEEEQEAETSADGEATQREMLRQRDYKVDLDSKLGKSQVITRSTPMSGTGGYYCNVCDCVVKDSINFLDHINGKKHQRNLGMSMKVERSSLDQVKKRLEMNKKKAEIKKKEYNLEERLEEVRAEEEKLKEYRREKRKERKRRHDGSDMVGDDELGSDMDPSMAAMMGFSGFGSSKK
ncbi:unnamed protein product [Notodromas monacha]|uniref:U1-type domain-containing protein n=1 Tax=Notodromas monacha TaxID=399045 RepID=A0A7R9GGT3_9CRUS|nr:unnamed protein product [Notodromas monacha]CAG0920756.1 unnamed protein product [Notodromas monacha]